MSDRLFPTEAWCIFAGDLWHHDGDLWDVVAGAEDYLEEDGGPSGVVYFLARRWRTTDEPVMWFAQAHDQVTVTPEYARS